jgi:hypothetical protein
MDPGTNKEIADFIKINYPFVTFPIFEKVEVNGKNEHEIFSFLKGYEKRAYSDFAADGSEEAKKGQNLAGQAKAELTYDAETELVPITKDLIKDISDANIQKMSAALSKLKSSQPSSAPPNKLQPAAIDLSVTIDGIEGIVFGNTITTNYIPSDYASSVYFTVTNVEHNISNSDWTTTLSTVMRMK